MKEDKIKIKAIKIGLLGHDAVGKTAIARSLLNLEFNEDILATIGIDKLETKFSLNNGNDIKLILWDTAWQERFRSSALKTVKAVQGIVLVFSVINYDSFTNMDLWLKMLLENYGKVIPIVLFGNKIDLPKENWQVTNEQAKEFAKKYNLTYFETSAKTKQGIEQEFSYIVNKSYKRLEEKINITNEKENQNIKI